VEFVNFFFLRSIVFTLEGASRKCR